MLNKIMYKFSVWFASPLGVMETFIAIFGIIVAERLFPGLDPNGFWVLYWLTVYSGVTQPILAYAATVSARESQNAQEELRQLQEDNKLLLKSSTDTTRALLAMTEHMQGELEMLSDKVDELSQKVNK